MTTLRNVLLVLSAFTFACGDSGSGGSGGSGGGSGGEGTGAGSTGGAGGGSGGQGGGGIECELPASNPGAENDVVVGTVNAAAEDENGDPIASTPLQLCGKDFCLYATTSAVGTIAFTNSMAGGTIDRPVFKPGDSLEYGKIGYPYAPGGPSPLVGAFPTMTDSGASLDPGTTVSAAGVELTVPDGVGVDELIYDTPDKQTFRAGRLTGAAIAAATGSAEFEMLFALGPYDTALCPGAAVTFENYADLAADAEVEIWGQILGVEEPVGGYGEWVLLSDGVVSSDGSTVSTTGDGLPLITTVAIKLK